MIGEVAYDRCAVEGQVEGSVRSGATCVWRDPAHERVSPDDPSFFTREED